MKNACLSLAQCVVVVLLVQRWKVGWDYSGKKRQLLSLITFDLGLIHCEHTLGCNVSKEQKLAMSLPATVNV